MSRIGNVAMGSDAISTLNEKPLHAGLKRWYARPGDRIEVPLGEFLVDIVRGDLLIEIQTANFSAIRRKLSTLVAHHPVRSVGKRGNALLYSLHPLTDPSRMPSTK